MKNTFIIILLAILTAGSYLLLKSLQKEEIRATAKQEKTIVATARGVTARYFNENNQLKYKLISPKVIEFSENYGMEFLSPDLSVFDDTQQLAWHGTSALGFLSENKDKLLLKKDVKIVQSPNGEQPTHISGEVMNYQASTQLLTSALPVTINDGVLEQISDTLKLNTNTKQVNADKRVRATYQTQ